MLVSLSLKTSATAEHRLSGMARKNLESSELITRSFYFGHDITERAVHNIVPTIKQILRYAKEDFDTPGFSLLFSHLAIFYFCFSYSLFPRYPIPYNAHAQDGSSNTANPGKINYQARCRPFQGTFSCLAHRIKPHNLHRRCQYPNSRPHF